MSDVPSDLLPIFRRLSEEGLFGGDLSMVCGWAFVESSFFPHAVRYEPAFYRRYVEPQGITSDTEARCRAMSWGLFQIMGQVARERGFKGDYLPALCDPKTNARIASEYLRDLKHRSDGTWEGALASYNGGLGGNRSKPYRRQSYVDKVQAAAERFRGPGGVCRP